MKKFRDETDEVKLEIIKNKPLGLVEMFYGVSKWVQSDEYSIDFDVIYRIKPRPMSIDWSVLKDEFIYAARNQYEQATAFTDEPRQQSGIWMHNGIAAGIEHLKSYDPGTVDWTESLIWRPGFESK